MAPGSPGRPGRWDGAPPAPLCPLGPSRAAGGAGGAGLTGLGAYVYPAGEEARIPDAALAAADRPQLVRPGRPPGPPESIDAPTAEAVGSVPCECRVFFLMSFRKLQQGGV